MAPSTLQLKHKLPHLSLTRSAAMKASKFEPTKVISTITPTVLEETSPSYSFSTPEKLLNDMNVEPDTKAALLQQWAADLEHQLKTSHEITPSAEPEQTGDLLRRVKTAQQQLAAV
jgi:hypothetical protein